MSDYVVSARKYRPDSFESLIGQDNIVKTLKNSILRGQLAHAYLFCGPRGVGKTSAARIFAKAINCANPGANLEPCGKCESCLSFQEGRSYCIHELDAASNNGIEDIKALMDQVQISPQVGRYSVFIIDEVHMLSSSAFNAFLKTLEEPPAHAIFILATTEKHKVIPTILSRCQTYDFNRISIPDIVRNLSEIAAKENISIDDESLHIIARKADGAMRDALTIFDQTVAFCGSEIKYEDVIRNLNVLDYEYSFRLVDAFLNGDYGSALLIFDEILGKGFNSLHFVSSLSSHLRDLLVSVTGGLDALLDLPESLKARYKEQSARCSVKFLYDALGITTQCEAGYRASTNQRLHIEYALMKLAFLNIVPASTAAVSQQAAAPQPVAAPQSVATTQPAVATPQTSAAPQSVATTQPESAPVVAESAPEQPAAPKRASKKASSLRMSKLMVEDEELMIEPLEMDAKPGEESALPEDSTIAEKWLELASMQSSQPRLSHTLASAKLSFREENGIKIVEFAVINEAQKQWIESKMLRNLEEQFCKLVNSNKLRLYPTVIPEEQQEDKKYMPAEKAQDLMAKNPEVLALVSDLVLDIR